MVLTPHTQMQTVAVEAWFGLAYPCATREALIASDHNTELGGEGKPVAIDNHTSERTHQRRCPILVTGVPRSGTTWLARKLASAPGTALAGREPMNPRGSQYGLGGTLQEWARVDEFNPRQARLLRSAYRGLNPLVYSRYGQRQWAAGWPWTRMIMKDPFAMLSLPAVVSTTGARPVLIYRHPGAVLSSYRRMGWTADLDEVRRVITPSIKDSCSGSGFGSHREVWEMAHFWAMLNNQALADMQYLPGSLVISHEELASGGSSAMHQLYELCGLRWDSSLGEDDRKSQGVGRHKPKADALHNLHRPPQEVAAEWRSRLTNTEVSLLDEVAGDALNNLDSKRAVLTSKR